MKRLPIKAKLFGVLASIFAVTTASAQDDMKLVIYNHDGSAPVEIIIDNVRKVTFQDTFFTVLYKDGMQADEQYLYDDVRNIKFEDVTTGIGNIKNEEGSEINISRSGSLITISGITEKAQVRLFDISGRQVLGRTVTADTTISTDELSEGVYILRVNNKSFKFSKF